MNIGKRISAAFKALRGFEDYDDKKYLEYLGAGPLKSGVTVNEITSLKLSAVFAAVNIYAGVFASVPKKIMRRLPGGGSEVAYDHPMYDRLHTKPNDTDMSAWNWIFSQVAHKFIWGQWLTWVKFHSYRHRELIPLLPDRTHLDSYNKNRYVTITDGRHEYIPASQVMHIPHFSLNGVTGKGVIHYARESLGISTALDQFAASYFGSGTHAGGIMQMQGNVDTEEKKRLQVDFNEKYSGLGKSHKVIFVTNAEYKPDNADPEKSQALESRQFSVEEVARWMNLPPHILRDLSRATFSNIEHQGIELVVYSFYPFASQIENAMNIAFFDEEERREYYVNFELKGLLRGDIKARTEFYTAMVDRGIFNSDDVLRLEDMNPQPNGLGSVYLVPLNMLNKEYVIKPQSLRIEGEKKSGEFPILRSAYFKRSAALRRKLTIAYLPKFQEYGEDIVAAEVKAIREAIADSFNTKTEADFTAWLDTFYPDFAEEIRKRAAPLLSSYATSILPVAQEEVGSEFDVSANYQTFGREYLDAFIIRHVDSSAGQLKELVQKARDEQIDPAELLEERLAEWEEKRGEKIAGRESVRGENAFSRSAFAFLGVKKLRSIAYRDTCPYCSNLDGKVIGIEEVFLPAGDFQPDGAERPLTVSSARKHPPYHDGCDCGIGPES